MGQQEPVAPSLRCTRGPNAYLGRVGNWNAARLSRRPIPYLREFRSLRAFVFPATQGYAVPDEDARHEAVGTAH